MSLRPLMFNYYDPVDGRNVVLDTITNATGWLTAPTEIIYSNCFSQVKASIRFRSGTAGVEQDVILHERPPPPEFFGLSAYSRFEIVTEQTSGPTPTLREWPVPSQRAEDRSG